MCIPPPLDCCISLTMPFRGKQHQISRGDNYNNFYLLSSFDHISFTSSHGVGGWGLRVGVWDCSWWVVRKHTLLPLMLFLVTIWCCLPALCTMSTNECHMSQMKISEPIMQIWSCLPTSIGYTCHSVLIWQIINNEV